MIKHDNLFVATKVDLESSGHERFEKKEVASTASNVFPRSQEPIIRKSYALTQPDIDHIKSIQDKCLNQKVVLNDSHVIRIALMLASKLEEDAIIKASKEVPKLVAGRPRSSK